MKNPRSDRQVADDIVALLNSEEDKHRHPAMTIKSLLQRAKDAGDGALRMQYLEAVQKEIAKLDQAQHGRLINQLQGEILALQGRDGDTQIAHVTPGEIVIPERLQTPELLAALRAAAKAQGIDPERLLIGSPRNSVNPNTGQAEFYETVPSIGLLNKPSDLSTSQVPTSGRGLLEVAQELTGNTNGPPPSPNGPGQAGGCPKGSYTVRMEVTAYTNGPESTGKRPGDPGYGETASTDLAGPGTIAAPRTYSFGTKMYVPGYGWGVVLDRGGAIQGNHLDVWFKTVEEARRWGRQQLDVIVCKG